MNKHQRGTRSELLAAAYFVGNGWSVSWPIDGFGEYDLLIDDGSGVPKRVQVKTAYWDNSKKRFLVSLVTSHIRGNLRRTNKKYADNSFDFLVAVEDTHGFLYQWACFDIVGKRSITVYPDAESEPHRYMLL